LSGKDYSKINFSETDQPVVLIAQKP